MKPHQTTHIVSHLTRALLGAGLLLGVGAASAADIYLCAKAGTVTMPDGVVVPIWAYVQDDNNDLSDGCAGVPTLPSPALSIPAADTVLTVHLRNDLPVPTSIVIPGQTATMTPVWNDGGTGPRGNSTTRRVRSFTHETAPGSQADYTWGDVAGFPFKPGTYLYHSGTHVQAQVQMGLYGAATKNFSDLPKVAYEGLPYDADAILLFSEIDPAQHAAIADLSFGTASAPDSACPDTDGSPMKLSSALCYKPKYFLINGKPHAAGDAPLATPAPNQAYLLRLLNAGLRAYVPTIQGTHLKMVAEDGNRYVYRDASGVQPRDQYQYSTWLAALKTTDAMLVPSGTSAYPLYDRRLHLVNNLALDGGMFGIVQATAQGADLSVTKTHGAGGVIAGGNVTYTIVVSNPGPEAAVAATVTDTLPATLTGASWTCAATAGSTCATQNGIDSIATTVDLIAGGSATFTVNAAVPAGTDGVQLVNTVNVAASNDPVAANNSATDTTTILAPSTNLAITKTDGVTTVTQGGNVTYTIVASNAGPAAVTAAPVTDTMPAALSAMSWSCSASVGGACGAASGTGSIATTVDLAVGATATFTVNGTVSATATGSLANTASIAVPAGMTDTVLTNNSATDTDTIQLPVSVRAYITTTNNTAPTGAGGTGDDADVYAWNSNGTYARLLDASTNGLPTTANVNALVYRAPNDIYLSFSGNVTIAGIGTVTGADIVRWNGTAWSLYFDGSDVGLTTTAENIDAFAFLADGSLVISTAGSPSVTGVTGATSSDLLRCVGSFGPTTSCTWSMYLDASDIGLSSTSENVRFVKVMPNGDIQLRTTGTFSTYNPPGTPAALSGNGSQVFSCNGPTIGTSSACTSFSSVLTGLPTVVDALSLP